MNVALFGRFGKRVVEPGWTNESAVGLFSSAELDLTGVVADSAAQLTVVSLFSRIEVLVDQDTQVTMSGFSFFGRREAETVGGSGPVVRVRAVAVFGRVNISSAGAA